MGEGGCVLDEPPALKMLVESLPRLGPRLLVRARRGQHLRQALRLAARRPAATATTTSTPTRTSATTSRPPTCRRRSASRSSSKLPGVHRGAPAELRAACARASPTWRSSSSCPQATPGSGPELVRLPDRRPRRRAVHTRRRRPLPRAAQDRDAPALRRQPGPPAGLPGRRASRRRRPAGTPTS